MAGSSTVVPNTRAAGDELLPRLWQHLPRRTLERP
jgi:hypothetical protein